MSHPEPRRVQIMKSARQLSIAEQEAEARKNSVLLGFAYHATPAKSRMLPKEFRHVRPELLGLFEELVQSAVKYKRLTGRHLPFLGELGELFAEIAFKLKRHKPMVQGSDGKLGNDFVEVKTITPDKESATVKVKRAGNFGRLIVVKITDDFQFGARMVRRGALQKDGEFETISWEDMIAGEPNPEIHRDFPFTPIAPKRKTPGTAARLGLSNYLSEVLQDWQASREEFPLNAYPQSQWPIPFFGNPATAVVATVGVNPSSDEFVDERKWPTVNRGNQGAWKERLRDYFQCGTPSHEWFNPWRIGLEMLRVSYEEGAAAHFDVSYRSTLAMVKNPNTDRGEFRRMVERDVKWFFKLLPLCPDLRLLLTFGPVIQSNGRCESLMQFLIVQAPKHGFAVLADGRAWKLQHKDTGKVLSVHNADTLGEKCITCRVVKNLHAHRHELRGLLGQQV